MRSLTSRMPLGKMVFWCSPSTLAPSGGASRSRRAVVPARTFGGVSEDPPGAAPPWPRLRRHQGAVRGSRGAARYTTYSDGLPGQESEGSAAVAAAPVPPVSAAVAVAAVTIAAVAIAAAVTIRTRTPVAVGRPLA